MKRVFASVCAAACLLMGAQGAARAQSFSIPWSTIDGGGGTSSGGNFTVSGTIGQPDAGRMTGGTYAVEGGFWGIVGALQSPTGPLLTIQIVGLNAVISWPAPSTGFNLQGNLSVTTTNWTNVSQPIVVTNGLNTVTVPAVGINFYRLKQ